MACEKCRVSEQSQFQAEIAIHCTEPLSAPWKAPVLVFPKLLICVQCGRAEFMVPKTELGLLVKDSIAAGPVGQTTGKPTYSQRQAAVRSKQTGDKAVQG
jgi:hypothetical protein